MNNIGEIHLIKGGITKKITLFIDGENISNDLKSIEKFINEQLENGYSVFEKRKVEYIREGIYNFFDDYKLNIHITKDLQEIDYIGIKMMENTLKQGVLNRYCEIHNHINGKYGIDHDRCINPHRKDPNLSFVLDYLLREKLGKLNNQEKEMMNQYRYFNLETLLVNSNENIINNDNAGVISIFEDKVYESTSTKIQHGAEVAYHVLSHYKDADLQKIKDENITNIVSKTNSIQIQVSFNQLIFWIPEKLNEFQINEMNRIIDIVKKCNVNNEFDILTAIIGDDPVMNANMEAIAKFDSLEELEAYMGRIPLNKSNTR